MIDSNDLDKNFKYEVAKEMGYKNITKCFSCGTCSACCPVREIEEKYNPRKIIRMVIFGMREQVLKSDFIWLCAACHICEDRCPQNIQLTKIMMALRNIARREGYIHPFFRGQIKLVSTFGRLYDVEDFDNKKRQRLGLPSVKKKFKEVIKITKKYLSEQE
jgi:heterodisulfide reductase subunit C